jgi:hypothetical protein
MSPLFLIIGHPIRAAEKLRQSPRWLGAFLVVAAGMIALRLASHPRLVEATLAALPKSATIADQSWARSVLDGDLLLRCAFLPLRQIAGMAAFALLLYLLCVVFAPPLRVRFKHVLALEVHAELLNLIGAWWTFVITSLVGDSASASIGVVALLTITKVFTLWYLVALSAGIVTFCGYSKLKGGILAATAWIGSYLFNALLLQSVGASMHLRV